MLIDELSQPVDKPVMSLSAYSIQGKRNHMEDYFDIGYQMKPCDQRRPNEWPYEYFYFGIFDGHGGSEAANYAKRNLLKFITKQKCFWSTDDDDVKRAIRCGFAETHAAMRKDMVSWCRTSRILPSTAGTTASVLFIKNGKFYTGHVGDSRIVISQENMETKHWISHPLTEDHKPESKKETERIQRAGGEVRDKIGVHRVVWKRPVLTSEIEHKLNCGPRSSNYESCIKLISTYPVPESVVGGYQTIPFLAIARSLGDFWSLNPYSGQYIVSPEPDVSCRPISPNDKCILLATDGLWNVINSSQAVRILQELNILKNGERQYFEDDYFSTDNFYDVAGVDSENHAQSLVYFAYQIWERKRLRSDNITVVVAMLHDILAHFHRVNKPYATRASLHLSPNNIHKDLVEQHHDGSKAQQLTIQLGQTSVFLEKIRLNKEPRFCVSSIDQPHDRLQRLENFLVLPPTILEQEYDFKHPKLVYPKNYMRLSIATCRKISRHDDGLSDSYIYIKRVSDDPADERKLPTRTNNSGKEVKDASAQATQCIHDFGQPWDQLLDEDIDDDDDDDDSDSDYDDMDIEEDDTELVFAHELDNIVDDDADNDLNEGESMKAKELEVTVNDEGLIKGESQQADEKSKIPQLRCLLNCTPPLRRSARNTYLSVSDHAKRKTQVTSNTSSIQKSKRRKSQPIRFNLSRI